MTNLEEFKSLLGEISDLSGIAAIAGWDKETQMPKGGADTRATQMSTLAKVIRKGYDGRTHLRSQSHVVTLPPGLHQNLRRRRRHGSTHGGQLRQSRRGQRQRPDRLHRRRRPLPAAR